MRIAFISPGYAPRIGGVETHVTEIARGVSRAGHSVEVWAQDATVDFRSTEIGQDGVVVRRFPTSASTRFPTSPSLWLHVQRYAGELELLHAQSYHVTGALAALRAPRSVPVVFTPHYHGTGHTPLAAALHKPYRRAGRRLFDRSAHTIAVSAAELALIEADFPAVKGHSTVIHNAVSSAAIHAATPFEDEPPTLLVLGRLEGYKRVDDVMRAFRQVPSPAQLVIVGAGPDQERLHSMARAEDRVRVLGRVSDGDVARWLRTSRAVVSMSEHEAFGMVALEGVAAGAPAILSDIPAHREISGLAPGRAVIVGREELSSALRRAAETPNGPIQQVRDWQAAVDEHLAVYDRVLA